MQTLVIATHNPKKGKELLGLVGRLSFKIRLLSDFPGAPKVRETASTFEGNAVLKARSAAKHTGCWSLADDSGLEVAFLRGLPGVRTARYARTSRAFSQDEANNRKLLKALTDAPASRRRARFLCTIALADPRGRTHITRGSLDGRIAKTACGRHGFGYDPVFIVPRYGATLAELGDRVKRRISHRAVAMRKAVHWLRKHAV